ncbi:MAG: hypothetical protein DMD87_12985 [Candidatus Rokuibacteriota bacterium]|nr:MAG: hypothetical protein DMD87_12985 [Candidatus Rokubacteria bacterium]
MVPFSGTVQQMTEPKCPRCSQLIASDDTLAFYGSQIFHLDCRRPRDLSHEERTLLFRYCWDHAVAQCAECRHGFRQQQLWTDLFSPRTHLCPECWIDLTASMRSHLYACVAVPKEVRRRAEEAREAARKLVKQSHQLSDRADVLMREAEAAIAALRETMRREASRRLT